MHLPHDLRGRVALFFAGFGALGSLTMAGALYQGAHDLGQRLIDETLSAELDDYIARRERNPASMPPSTVVVHGYVQGAAGADEVPAYLTRLPVGNHDIRLGTVSYRAAIVERGGARYYLLHDTALQARREQRFAWMLGLLAVTMTLLSALGGVWVSRTVVAPVTDLAELLRTSLSAGSLVALPLTFLGGVVTGLNPCCVALYPAAAATCCASRGERIRLAVGAALAFVVGLALATTSLGVFAETSSVLSPSRRLMSQVPSCATTK